MPSQVSKLPNVAMRHIVENGYGHNEYYDADSGEVIGRSGTGMAPEFELSPGFTFCDRQKQQDGGCPTCSNRRWCGNFSEVSST